MSQNNQRNPKKSPTFVILMNIVVFILVAVSYNKNGSLSTIDGVILVANTILFILNIRAFLVSRLYK